MLSSLLGVRLLLWTGSTIPTPPPASLGAALIDGQVTNDAESGDGFQLRFALGKDASADYDLLSSGRLDPMTRVWIGAIFGAVPEALIDGIVTHHEVQPNDEPGASTLTVTGSDVSVMLDLNERNDRYPNQPDALIVTQRLASYATYGLVPEVTPTTDVPIELERVPRQHETDLRFIRRLAERNGFVFFVEPVTFGVNRAYWGTEMRAGLPQPALTIGMGPHANVRSLSFTNDALAPLGAEGSFVEPLTKTSLPIPAMPALRLPPLAARPSPVHRTRVLREAGNKGPIQGALSAVAEATRAPEAVRGQGELDGVRYGSALRARRTVGVRGAGLSYDGQYYVRSVTHRITKGSYTQSFVLSRDGTGSLLPVVRP